MRMLALLSLLIGVSLPLWALAEPGIPAFSVQTNAEGQQEYTLTLQILLLMTGLTLLPAALMTMTSFLRIVIVLSILRQALGTMQTPSNQVLIGLALFMTLFIMAPIFDKINENAIEPYLNEQLNVMQAIEAGSGPMRQFMMQQTREDDLAMFAEMANVKLDEPDSVPFRVLIPSFITSELKTAFQIGFLLFIPFLIIDLVVASLLMSMGMMMLSPMIISMPFKLMLFVLIDGWALIMGTLANSFVVPGGV
ncbi:MAG: flagellar biosynthetic protein FliP [Thiotrichales bacterium 32-46-8]|nr:flagellar type III secretion system pore protein FliP [Gammaproteobacteria bacterium]OYX07402.1 MAG: flagellar biosynthetic protein FliP [Thiotrichales bacterium 32-46-8]OYY24322.1 MAG: flagellar biosynthetic protein FliP [Thiotrichales bacterium 35-46-9]OZB85703.1 MAG: flagellar biosynthetic protein FliP [Thiotrichales bacterium 12-47-6]UCG18103.1 MAG: flagellar type III secretion system pore protein FliP [Thiotrichales bacterium]